MLCRIHLINSVSRLACRNELSALVNARLQSNKAIYQTARTQKSQLKRNVVAEVKKPDIISLLGANVQRKAPQKATQENRQENVYIDYLC